MQKVIDTEPFQYWMTNVIEQNKTFDSFSRSLARIDEGKGFHGETYTER